MKKTSTLQPLTKLFTRLLIIIIIISFGSSSFAQTPIYTETFDAYPSLPSDWTVSSSAIAPNNTNSSTSYPNGTSPVASGGANLLFTDNSFSTESVILHNHASTVNNTAIEVIWGTTYNDGFPTPRAYWGTDGSTWTQFSYNNPPADQAWRLTTLSATLPVGAQEVSDLYIKLEFDGSGSGLLYYIDDFQIRGVTPTTTFYSKSSGALNLLSSWGTSTNGSGTSPLSFSTSGQTFNVANNSTPTLSADWDVSGAGSKVVVKTGINFTIPATYAYSSAAASPAPIYIDNGGTLTIQNNTFPLLGTLGSSSTVIYDYTSSPPTSLPTNTYGNLTLLGSIDYTMGGNITVNGAFNYSSSANSLNVGNNTLTLNGTSIGSGFIAGNGTTSNLTIGGSGAFGTLKLTGSGFANFTVSSSGTVTLGNSFTVSNLLSLQSGKLDLNGKILTIGSGASIGIVSGKFIGSNTSSILFNGTGIGGTLSFDQTSASTRSLKNLNIASGRSIILGSSMDMASTGTLLLNSGTSITIAAYTLTVTGAVNLGGGTILSDPTGTVLYNGVALQNVAPGTYGNLTLTGTKTLSSTGTVAIAGTFTPSASTGNTVTSSTISLSGTGAQSIPDFNYNNLTLTTSGVKTPTPSTLTVGGNLTISGSASLAAGTGTIQVGGNWATYGSTGFTEGTSTVVFNGSGTQSISSTAGSETFNNLTISKTGALSLTDSVYVLDLASITSGTLTTNNKFKLVSTSSKTAALVDANTTGPSGSTSGSVTGNVIAQRYVVAGTAEAHVAHYFSAPVYNITADQLQSYSTNFYYFQENKAPATGTYTSGSQLYTKVTTPSSETMSPGKGYSIRLDNGTTVTKEFTGQPNNGTINLPVTFTDRSIDGGFWIIAGNNGSNLVGNPYPSAIDANVFMPNATHIDQTVYVWNGTQNVFWTVPGGGAGSLTNGIIGSGQGFFVTANGSSPSLPITNAARVSTSGSNNKFYRTATNKAPVLELSVYGNTYSDVTYVRFLDDAILGFDHNYDAYKYAGIPAAPMLCSEAGNINLALNSLPKAEETIIPLRVKVGATTSYEFKAAGLSDFDPNMKIYLEDKLLNTIQDLRTKSNYLFVRTAGDTTERFNLIFTTKGIVSGLNSGNDLTDDEQITIYSYKDKKINVSFNKDFSSNAMVSIYDVLGNKVYELNNMESTKGIHTINFSGVDGIYIVKVQTGKSLKTQKVFVN